MNTSKVTGKKMRGGADSAAARNNQFIENGSFDYLGELEHREI